MYYKKVQYLSELKTFGENNYLAKLQKKLIRKSVIYFTFKKGAYAEILMTQWQKPTIIF